MMMCTCKIWCSRQAATVAVEDAIAIAAETSVKIDISGQVDAGNFEFWLVPGALGKSS
ncbi:hypothetical protein Patl1_27915 [Pistacia atlantica]|uniref:Uncharacterized protein n=1 Tax=Pistacia atlantica TaxID=434234 RepID=A0ACC1BCI3_9ROSI|nr:hypothetical protein Patl1_27915 [Pistacia atlantica]